MRILCMSDTHGHLDQVQKLIQTESEVDVLLHLGDLGFPSSTISQMQCVKGNHDEENLEEEYILVWKQYRILCLHGHTVERQLGKGNISSYEQYIDELSTLLAKRAKQKQCQMVLYGHTHKQDLRVVEGIIICNPGSLSLPILSKKGYAVIEIEENIQVFLKEM